MSGCTNCASKTGCSHRKGELFAVLDDTLARLYPTGRWGELDLESTLGQGLSREDGEALAAELEQELKARAVWRPGADDEFCDYIYVLCFGRSPCIVELLDEDADIAYPAELESATVTEAYLRVCISSLAPVAAVQEVHMTLESAGDIATITQRTRAGVFDAPFLARMQKLVAILPAYGLTHLDFGEIDEPPKGFDGSALAQSHDSPGTIANYLFYPQAPTLETTTVVPVTARRLDQA